MREVPYKKQRYASATLSVKRNVCLSRICFSIIFYIGLAGEKHFVATSASALRDSIFRMDEEGEGGEGETYKIYIRIFFYRASCIFRAKQMLNEAPRRFSSSLLFCFLLLLLSLFFSRAVHFIHEPCFAFKHAVYLIYAGQTGT